MSRSICLAALVLLALAASASAQCIECSQCKGSGYCLSVCKRSCSPAVNAETCKQYGRDMGRKAANDACSLVQTYCSQTRTVGGPAKRTYVSLNQCQNIAYGQCQAAASNQLWNTPCKSMTNGWKACTKAQFNEFWTGEVNYACNAAAAAIK